MTIWAKRMYQIQVKPRGAFLSVIPEKIPMVIEKDGCNCNVQRGNGPVHGVLRVELIERSDRRDGGIRSGRPLI